MAPSLFKDMSRHIYKLILALSLFTVFIIYKPGFQGYFQFDDFPNIVKNPHIQITTFSLDQLFDAATSGTAGPLGRPLSLLSFAVNHLLSGFDAYQFKLTNLILHLFNGILIYLLTKKLFKHKHPELPSKNLELFSICVCISWLLLPINVSGVLYVVQRMNQLSSFFILAGMLVYVRMRQRDAKCSVFKLFSIMASFTLLASLSKENGVLLPPLLLLIEITFFNFKNSSGNREKPLLYVYLFFSTVAILVAICYVFLNPESVLGAYKSRNFNLSQRLLTESRVICFYIKQILLPDVKQFGFHQDDIVISQSLTEPITTLYSVLTLALVAIVSTIQLLKKYSVWSFCILFFLVGHSLESSFIGLEIAFEHRNYLPSLGLVILLCHTFLVLFRKIKLSALGAFCLSSLIIFNSYITINRTTEWGDYKTLKHMEVARHPNSSRANLNLGYYYFYAQATSQTEAESNYRNAYKFLARSSELAPHEVSGLVGLISLKCEHRLEIDPSWINALIYRLKYQPFSSSTSISVQTIEEYAIEKRCKISSEMYKKILLAALENKTLNQVTKHKLQMSWVNYLIALEHRVDVAEMAILNFDKDTKSVELRLSLAMKCLEIDKPKCSSKILGEIKPDVTSFKLKKKFAELENATNSRIIQTN